VDIVRRLLHASRHVRMFNPPFAQLAGAGLQRCVARSCEQAVLAVPNTACFPHACRAMPGMEDFDGNGLVWTPLSSVLEQYAQAVTLPHVDLHTDMVWCVGGWVGGSSAL
jgi:hypothetical protein